MKILVVCQHYSPEPFRITDVCEALAQRGHEVTVVTGLPNYPEGEIYPGYTHGQRRDEVINSVQIHRCWTIPRKHGALWRLLNYISFPLSSGRYVRTKACAARDGSTFDVVLVNQLSPIMMACAGLAYKKMHIVPVVLYCLDLWPESLIVGGIRRNSAVYRFFHGLSRKIYTRVDKILVTSRLFTDYLHREFDIPEQRIEYLPQYAEELFAPLPIKDTDTFDFVFAGNIGVAQSVDTILHAAAMLRNEPVHFHIVGGGSDLERLQQLAQTMQLLNVTFYGRCPLEEMPHFYAMADAMLVTMKADPVLSLTLPGKVQSYMAAAKPIIGAINGETETVIRESQCGLCGPAEDGDTLAGNIRAFISDANRTTFGLNAGAYYETHFAKERFLDNLERNLQTEAVK